MAPVSPKNIIQHFTHPHHPLALDDSNTRYLCDGCKIPGMGKRYHCHSCEFDLHEYCGKCPMNLSSFMHPHHSLKLVARKPKASRQIERICNVCCDTVEGLFYRCEVCEFDVHPLCTQLPETLKHVLHQVHPLRLLGSSEPGTCAVCRGACNAFSWRYRCALCQFDIHLECVSVQCEKKINWLGISTYVAPSIFPHTQYFGGYAYEIPYWNPSSSSVHHQSHGQLAQTHHGGTTARRIGKIIFILVKVLAAVVIFGL